MLTLFYDYTFQNVLLGVSLIGLSGGLISVYLTLRQQSLVGDLVSHATLPGIVIAFLLFGVKLSLYFSIAAMVSALLSTLLLNLLARYTKIKNDTLIAINLSAFFGFGILLLSYLQKSGNENQSGIRSFLFGQAAALTKQDVNLIFAFTLVIIFLTMLFWKELKLLSFDQVYYSSLGYSTFVSDLISISLVVIAVTLGIQVVGVTLMAAMVIAPAAAARQWADSLLVMTIISVCFAITSAVLGTIFSSIIPHLPTGPTVVIFLSLFVFISLLFSPKRGLVARYFAHYHNSQNIKLEYILADFIALAQQHKDPQHAHTKKVLSTMTHKQHIQDIHLKRLENMGWIEEVKKHRWSVTNKGYEKFEEIKHKYFQSQP